MKIKSFRILKIKRKAHDGWSSKKIPQWLIALLAVIVLLAVRTGIFCYLFRAEENIIICSNKHVVNSASKYKMNVHFHDGTVATGTVVGAHSFNDISFSAVPLDARTRRTQHTVLVRSAGPDIGLL